MTSFQPRQVLNHIIQQFLKKAQNIKPEDSKNISILYNHIKLIAKLEDRIANQSLKKFRAQAGQMSTRELSSEKGKPSKLRNNLNKVGIPVPDGCHAHHIVPWKEVLAYPARLVLAMHKIRIDDEINGVALPSSKVALDNNAVAKSHTMRAPHLNLGKEAYINGWINRKINPNNTPTEESLKLQLRIIQFRFETCAHPKFIFKNSETFKNMDAQAVIDLDDKGIEAIEYDDDGNKTAQFLAANPQFSANKKG
ncbi:AHH domain-containing protein [Sessilibacter sp. MAH2]